MMAPAERDQVSGRARAVLAVVLGWILFMVGSLAIFAMLRLLGGFLVDQFLARLVVNFVATVAMLWVAEHAVRRKVAPDMSPVRFAASIAGVVLVLLVLALAIGAATGALASAIGVLAGLVLTGLILRRRL